MLKPDQFYSDRIINWTKAFDDAKFEKTDIDELLASIFAVKDEISINCIKTACEITSCIFSRFLKKKILNTIENDEVYFIVDLNSKTENS